MEAAAGETVIKHPWDDHQLLFAGVPPRTATLHEMRGASNQQKNLTDKLMKRLDGRLDGLVDARSGGAGVTRLTDSFNESAKDSQKSADRLAGA